MEYPRIRTLRYPTPTDYCPKNIITEFPFPTYHSLLLNNRRKLRLWALGPEDLAP